MGSPLSIFESINNQPTFLNVRSKDTTSYPVIDHTKYSNDFYINVLDEKGNLISNKFPIKISKERDNIFSTPPFLVNNLDSTLGVITGHYNFKPADMLCSGCTSAGDLAVYFDIYSADGKLTTHTRLSEYPDVGILFILNPVIADLNNDGNREVVTGVSYVSYSSLLSSDTRYNEDTYETTFYIMDNRGNLISSLPENGYMVDKIAIGNFGNENPSVISTLSTTWPTDDLGPKLISFNYDASKNFEVNVPWSYPEGLVIGDVDGDENSDIVFTTINGAGIFDKEGILKKEVKIPSTNLFNTNWNNPPILADFNNDGKLDIIQPIVSFTSDYQMKTRIFAYSLNGDFDSSKLDWPMFQHDPQHTGCYDCDQINSTVPDPLPTTYSYQIAYDSNSSVDPDCWFADKNKNCNTGDFWSISTKLPQSSYGCVSGSKSRLPEPYNGWILQNYTATRKAAPAGRSCGDNTNRIINITLSKDPIHYPT